MKKKVEEPVKVSSPVGEDEMGLFNNKHYGKQMDIVRTILNLKRKDYSIEDAARKVQLAPSYVELVFKQGEDQMDCYWRKLHRIKRDYRGKIDES